MIVRPGRTRCRVSSITRPLNPGSISIDHSAVSPRRMPGSCQVSRSCGRRVSRYPKSRTGHRGPGRTPDTRSACRTRGRSARWDRTGLRSRRRHPARPCHRRVEIADPRHPSGLHHALPAHPRESTLHGGQRQAPCLDVPEGGSSSRRGIRCDCRHTHTGCPPAVVVGCGAPVRLRKWRWGREGPSGCRRAGCRSRPFGVRRRRGRGECRSVRPGAYDDPPFETAVVDVGW